MASAETSPPPAQDKNSNGFTAVNGETPAVMSFRPLDSAVATNDKDQPSSESNGTIKRKAEENVRTASAEDESNNTDHHAKRPRHSQDASLPADRGEQNHREQARPSNTTESPGDERLTPISISGDSVSPRSETVEPHHQPQSRRRDRWIINPNMRPEDAATLQDSLRDRSRDHRSSTGQGEMDDEHGTANAHNGDHASGGANGDGGTRRKREFAHRTKTGCHTCRQRKKKCDEGRPVCQNCVRGKFECAGYGAKPPPGLEKGVSRTRLKYPQPLQSKPGDYGPGGRQAGEMVWHHSFHGQYGPEPPRQGSHGTYPPTSSYQTGPSQHSVYSGPPQPSGPGLPPSQQLQQQTHSQPQLAGPSAPMQPHGQILSHSQHQSGLPPINQPTTSLPPPPTSSYGQAPAPNHDSRNPWVSQPYSDAPHPHLQHNTLGNIDFKNIPPPWSQSGRQPSLDLSSLTQHSQSSLSGRTFGDRRNSGHLPPLAGGGWGALMVTCERDKMLAGMPYAHWKDEDLIRDRKECKKALDLFNRAALPAEGMSHTDRALRFKAVLEPACREHSTKVGLRGSCGPNTIVESPFHCDFGYNLSIGSDVVIKPNCYIQDPCAVSIGNRVIIGPNARFYGMTARLEASNRNGCRGEFMGGAIVIEDDVFIGGDAIILPYRRIGRGAIVAAGAVVTRNVKEFTVVAGNPAKVVREITEGSGDRRMRSDIEGENQAMIRHMENRVRDMRRTGR